MFVHQPVVVYLCVGECILCVCDIDRRMLKVDYETFTDMSGRGDCMGSIGTFFIFC